MATIDVKYVGLKPQETDCVAGTKETWVGHGDVKTVPAKAWAIMSKHPDVWEMVEGSEREDAGLSAALPKLHDARAAELDAREAALNERERLLNEREAAAKPRKKAETAAADAGA